MAQDIPKTEPKNVSTRPGDGGPVQDGRIPTYPKMSREYLSERTLMHFQLPYREDPYDANYLIVFREMDISETDVLFEHTRRLRAGTLPMRSEERRHSAPGLVVPEDADTKTTPAKSPGRRTVSSGLPSILKRTDSMSPELSPPIELKVPKTAAPAVERPVTPKTPPPRYANIRVYRRDVSEDSLRYYEIPYQWHPSEPDCFTLLREVSDTDMEDVFRHTRESRADRKQETSRPQTPQPSAFEQLAALRKTLKDSVWPQCESFRTSDLPDGDRKDEYEFLSQVLIGEMLVNVNEVDVKRDDEAKAAKVELLMECHRVMRALDEMVKGM